MRYRNQKDCRSGFYAASLIRLLQGREAKRRNFCRSLTPLCSLLLSTCSTLLFCLLNSDTVLFLGYFLFVKHLLSVFLRYRNLPSRAFLQLRGFFLFLISLPTTFVCLSLFCTVPQAAGRFSSTRLNRFCFY